MQTWSCGYCRKEFCHSKEKCCHKGPALNPLSALQHYEQALDWVVRKVESQALNTGPAGGVRDLHPPISSLKASWLNETCVKAGGGEGSQELGNSCANCISSADTETFRLPNTKQTSH